eukprot:scaffold7122_cov118-Skeletonema_dohrnii-CCMP3373.AAC.1
MNHQPDHIRDHVVLSMNMTYQHHYHIHFYGHPIAPYVNQNGNKFHSDDYFLRNYSLSASDGGSHHVKLSSSTWMGWMAPFKPFWKDGLDEVQECAIMEDS